MSCKAELGELQDVQRALERRGGALLALAISTREEARQIASDAELGYPVLSDQNGAVTKAYGLTHAGGGPAGKDISVPAHVLIAMDGKIVWRHAARKIHDRPAPADDLAAIADLK